MPRPRRRRRFALPLFLLCLALGYLIYLEIGSPPEALRAGPADPPPAEEIAALPSQPSFAMAPIESFSEIVTRPLFSELRRPPIPDAEPGGEPEPIAVPKVQRGLFVLVGVVITGQTRLAIVRNRKANEVVRLERGARIEGWTVESIEPDRVVFRQGAEIDEVNLDDSLAPPPAVPTPKRKVPRERREQRMPEELPSDEHATNG